MNPPKKPREPYFICKTGDKYMCPGSRVNYCEDQSNLEDCLDSHSNMTKPVDGHGRYYNHYYQCNYDTANKTCFLDPTCPCICHGSFFDLDDSDPSLECSDIPTEIACESFHKKKRKPDGKQAYWPCKWVSTGGITGKCTQGTIECDATNPDAGDYYANTCTLGVGTTDHCKTICEDAVTGSVTESRLVFEKECPFYGHSRYCYCKY